MNEIQTEINNAPYIELDDDFSILPFGYLCNETGVYIKGDNEKDKDDIRITFKPVWVEALSRDGNQENWGVLLRWVDRDGKKHKLAVCAGRLHSKGNELAQELATSGLPIVPRKESNLLAYLAAFHPKIRLTSATTTGWLGESFVLPQQTINEASDSKIVFQPTEYHAASEAIYPKGSLDDWKKHIAEKCVTDITRFALCSSLAAPLRDLALIESGGFHFFGTTSTGKTTMLQAASSVWGNGADPALAGGSDVYLQRWNATKNGLEGMAVSFNDLPLCIDEIGEGDTHDFGRIIYQLMSGTGKARATQTGAGRKRRSWRATLLSVGELSVSAHIKEGGQKARGGQLIRMIDIPANNIFPDKESADYIKRYCGTFFGTAGPALLTALIHEGINELRKELANLDPLAEKIGEASTNEASRVRKRFALIAFVGEMAIHHRILPWNSGAALAACQKIFESWVGSHGVISDAVRGIGNIRAFINAHGASRFESKNETRVIINRAGWYRDGLYHFTPQAFEEACDGVLTSTVKYELKKCGMLHFTELERSNNRIRVDGQLVRVISVKAQIFDEAVPGVPGKKTPAGTLNTPIKPTKSTTVPNVPGVPAENQQIRNEPRTGGINERS